MSKNNDNRVLSRMGARALTHEELKQVAGSGGPGTSLPCANPNLTGNDGECGDW